MGKSKKKSELFLCFFLRPEKALNLEALNTIPNQGTDLLILLCQLKINQ